MRAFGLLVGEMEGGMPMVESSHVYAVSNASYRDDRIQIRLLEGSIVLAPNAHDYQVSKFKYDF